MVSGGIRLKYADRILKFLSTATGLFCILYGTLGMIGLNPAGFHDEWSIRLTGMLMLFLGVLYLYPNARIVGRNFKKIYYWLCAAPFLVVFACAFATICRSGWRSFLLQGGPETTLLVSTFAFFAPASLYFYEQRLVSRG